MTTKEQIRKAAEDLERRRQAAAVPKADLRACIDRYRAYQTHEFDPETEYCVHCGQQSTYAIKNRIHCFGDDSKIVAISHLRRPPVDELAGADDVWKSPA